MDVAKLSGIAEAIEQESKLPHPSHGNLARLCGMFNREVIGVLEDLHNKRANDTSPITLTQSSNGGTVVIEPKRKRSKKSR